MSIGVGDALSSDLGDHAQAVQAHRARAPRDEGQGEHPVEYLYPDRR